MKSIVSLLIVTFLLYLYLLYPTDEPDIVRFIVISQLLAAVYFALLFFSRKHKDLFESGGRFFVFIITAAIVTHVVVSLGAGDRVDLSDDVFRYVWEGKIVSSGYNPYTLSPADLLESPLADTTIYPKINHSWLPTIYPPMSQYFFALAHMIGGDSIIGFKILSLLADIFALLLALMLIKQMNLPRWSIMIYAFSPLLIIEFLFSNHHDILAIPFLLAFMIVVNQRSNLWAGFMLGLVTCVKLFGLFFLPVLALHYGGRKRLVFLGSFLLTVLLLYAPFLLTAGTNVFGSLFNYLGGWQYNGSLFELAKLFVSAPIARLFSASVFFVGSAFMIARNRQSESPLKVMFYIVGLFIICAPALFSWYLIWIIPFLMIYRNHAFLLLTGTIFLAYHVLIGYYATGQWSEFWQLRVLEYLPFYGLLLYQFIRQPSTKEALL